MSTTIDQPLDILVIEQEPSARQALVEGLQSAGHRIAPFADAAECVRHAMPALFDLAFISQDAGLSRGTMAKLRHRCPHMRVVLALPDTAAMDAESVGQEIVGCVHKPVPLEYAQQLARCVAELRTMEEALAEGRVAAALASPVPIVAPRNTRMRRVLERARQLASAPAPLLLRGEFGVGKRVLASLLHQWGPHPEAPLILVRAHSADALLSPREAAERLRHSDVRGTLVFEEIGEFTLAQQGEILDLIAARTTGDHPDETLPPGVRIVATTSEDLSVAAKQGAFHAGLLSFLMDEELYLPPLRERPEDITALSEQMLAHFSHLYHRPGLSLEADAKLALERYPWPGNVHELRNALERVVLTTRKPQIGESDFRLRPAAEPGQNRTGSFLSLDAMEKQHIQRVMRASSTLD